MSLVVTLHFPDSSFSSLFVSFLASVVARVRVSSTVCRFHGCFCLEPAVRGGGMFSLSHCPPSYWHHRIPSVSSAVYSRVFFLAVRSSSTCC
jgi:hypothetical protein